MKLQDDIKRRRDITQSLRSLMLEYLPPEAVTDEMVSKAMVISDEMVDVLGRNADRDDPLLKPTLEAAVRAYACGLCSVAAARAWIDGQSAIVKVEDCDVRIIRATDL